MGTKSDFAQKLLHDLRLRKERMAAIQNTDAYGGSSREIFRESRGTKTLQKATSQIVPYGGHQSGQISDLSIALACAFDNRGQLKTFQLKGNGTMMNLLQQIGSRSMQHNPNIQRPSANQYPTLTNLHINEIAKGAQKINQILRVCSNGLSIDKGSVEVGKELWKGAMELEQSLRKLVSLQEASDCMARPQRKSHLKLLQDGEDSEEDNTSSMEKQQQVERPVFSFDKPSKSTKRSVQIAQQQKQLALTYPKEYPNSEPKKQGSTFSQSSHRRSASCGPDFQTSLETCSSKSRQNKEILQNVIAKLMGLEEIPQNIHPNVPTESQPIFNNRSDRSVSTRTTDSKSSIVESKPKNTNNIKVQDSRSRVESNQTTFKPNKLELQGEMTNTVTHNYSYETTPDKGKPRQDRKERKGTKNILLGSQEATYKITELQSHITQEIPNAGGQRDNKMVVNSIKQKQQEAKIDTDVTQKTVATESIKPEFSGKLQAASLDTLNVRGRGTRAAYKPPLNQKKQKAVIQSQADAIEGHEPHGKKLRPESTWHQTIDKKSHLKKRKGEVPKSNNSATATREIKNLRKELLEEQQSAGHQNRDRSGLTETKEVLSSEQIDDPTVKGVLTNSDIKDRSTVNPISKSYGPSRDTASESEVCTNLNIDAKTVYVPKTKAVGDLKPPKISPTIKANGVMTKTVETGKTSSRSQIPIVHGLKQKKLKKLATSGAQAQTSTRTSKSTRQQAKADLSTKSIYKESPRADVEQRVRDEADSQQLIEKTYNKSENTTPTASNDKEHQQPITEEFLETEPQETTADGKNNSQHNFHSRQQEHQKPTKTEKQEPLTEDEMNLKHKLITSHLFLNMAEAIFKLNIPIGILNYASEQICQDKENKLILDCSYELLKQKGRIKEIFQNTNINNLMGRKEIQSLDDLVRQLHKDFQTLKSYGKSGRHEHDDAEYLLNMLESDIYYRSPIIINCMWDLGWKNMMFAYTEMDEVIKVVEQDVLDEVVAEIVRECL